MSLDPNAPVRPGAASPDPLDRELASAIGAICSALAARTGHDFRGYKQGTLLRRIRRRVEARGAGSAEGYLGILEGDPAEPALLLRDLLIGVTRFFREPEAFEALADRVLPGRLAGEDRAAPWSIWVPGCASGEEAYSLAIVALEALERQGIAGTVQVLGTDIDAAALGRAREGRYGAEIEDHVTPARRARFFEREGTGWRVGPALRQACRFRFHDLLRDPPPSDLDLISCRNLLIYLEPELQARLEPVFHRALRPGGHLQLGSAEGLPAHGGLFEPVDPAHRLHRRRDVPADEAGVAASPHGSPDRATWPAAPPGSGAAQAPAPPEPGASHLEAELRSTRERLSATVEELGAVNEELLASNEELTAANEELRAANEELVSSKDELRALNQRLEAVNAELERKVAELDAANARLREGEARLARSQEIAHLGSWELDLVENRLIWSDEVYRIFGLAPQEFGATYEAFLAAVHPDDRAAVNEAYTSSIRDGRDAYEIEHRVVRVRTGEIRIVHEKCFHLRDEEGGIVRSLGMVHDVTELVRARQALEESGRHKDQFLAMLSHELRNPLAPIRNSLYVLGRAPADGERARRAHAIIDRQVAHMSRLVDDLLDVTRISRGKIELRRERLELGEVARRTAEDLRSTFVEAGVDLVLSVAGTPLAIEGDRTRVAQVIGNLLHNAAKFTPAGGVVRLSVEADPAGGRALVRLRDSGVGIEPALAERIFEPFAQAEVTLARSKGGLGLGLALARSLMELHGGTIAVESAGTGQGAEFTLAFPLPAAARAAALAPAGPAPGAGAGRRVLVIEDNADAAASLGEALELFGHTVALAGTGPAGLERARSFGPQVILCDIGLPGMDGFGVARELRKDPAFGGVRLVALSGYATPEDVAQAREAGFDRHLAKPPSLEDIEALLAEPLP